MAALLYKDISNKCARLCEQECGNLPHFQKHFTRKVCNVSNVTLNHAHCAVLVFHVRTELRYFGSYYEIHFR